MRDALKNAVAGGCMFEKISKEKFKKIILFKYTFQLILVHFILGTIGSIIIFVEEWIRLGWEGAIQSFFVEFPAYLLGYAISLFCGLTNILSVIPYCEVIADCIKGGEEGADYHRRIFIAQL